MNCNDFLLFSLSFNCLKDFWMHVMVSHCFPLQFQWFSMVFQWNTMIFVGFKWWQLPKRWNPEEFTTGIQSAQHCDRGGIRDVHLISEGVWRFISLPTFPSPPPFSKWTFNAGWHHDCQTNLSVSCPHLNTGIMGVKHISKDKCALWRRVGGRDTWGGKNSTPDRPPLSNACREFLKARGFTNNQQSESLRNYNVFVDAERFSMIFIVFHRLHSSLNEFQ